MPCMRNLQAGGMIPSAGKPRIKSFSGLSKIRGDKQMANESYLSAKRSQLNMNHEY